MVLVSCGGGGGTSVTNNAPPVLDTPPPIERTLFFGYYGTGVGQVAATFDHVNLCWVGPWGGFDAQVGFLQECASRGLPAIVDLSYLLFENRIYVGSQQARANLGQYLSKLNELGVLPLLKAIYPIDEPDLNLDTPGDVVKANADIRAVELSFGLSVPLAVIYGNQGTPGIESFDWVGRDWYNHGPQNLPMLPGQKRIIIAGGAEPFRESPSAYEDAARFDPDIVAVIAFVWFDYEGGLGIGHNGMAPDYRAAGCRLTRKC